ncbi:hypothetical protein HispidOSU_027159, partial [Sigmodon hispidus]
TSGDAFSPSLIKTTKRDIGYSQSRDPEVMAYEFAATELLVDYFQAFSTLTCFKAADLAPEDIPVAFIQRL